MVGSYKHPWYFLYTLCADTRALEGKRRGSLTGRAFAGVADRVEGGGEVRARQQLSDISLKSF